MPSSHRFVVVAAAFVVASILAACSDSPVEHTVGAQLPARASSTTDAVQSTELAAVADSWVTQYRPKRNYGSATSFAVRGTGASGLLRFEVPAAPGVTITAARLHLTGTSTRPGSSSQSGASPAHSRVAVYATTASWKESGVTWLSAPRGGLRIANRGTPDAEGSGTSWDVGAAVPAAGGDVNLRLEVTATRAVRFASREAGPATAPTLEITTTTVTGTAAVPTATPAAPPGAPRWSPPAALPATPSASGQPPATTQGAAKGSSSGSGSTPPAGSGGWTLRWSDDFGGSALGAGWGAYEGAIGAMPGGTWSRDQVEVGDGMLKLHSSRDAGGRWTSGGAMNSGPSQQTYGRYLVRFRMDRAPGVKYAVILWPDSERWPDDGEIDFAEDGGGARAGSSATVHWGTSADHQQESRNVKADFSQWHTMGVEWTPGKLVYTLDGKPYGTVSGAMVPSTPMNLVIQTEAGSCGEFMTCADASTPAVTTMYVDWAASYTAS